jgi:hypothetical protein
VVFREFGTTDGAGFQKLEPLKAYSINISGSMLGVLVFALSSTPWLWLLVCMRIGGLFAFLFGRGLYADRN